MPRDELAALIIAARKRAGYKTRYQLAQASGVATSTLGSIETGAVSPTVETLEKIMDAIGCDFIVTFRPRKANKRKSQPQESGQ